MATSTTLFHVTAGENAAAILRNGFRDVRGTYLSEVEHTGVWLSDRPLDSNEGPDGDVILSVLLPQLEAIADFEWVEDGKPYREWLVPAALVNQIAAVSIYEESDSWIEP